MSPSTLTIQKISCERGEKLLFNNMSFIAQSQQCWHITGANGCGKSSLLKIVAGLLLAEKGTILWNEKPIHINQDYLHQLSYIGHNNALKNTLSVIDNLRYYQQLLNANTKNSEQQLDNTLSQLNLLSLADTATQQLSFGQRRRLAFCRLLLKPTQLWLLDEPFTGIDTLGCDTIEKLLLTHLQNNGIILLSHHHPMDDSCLSSYINKLTLPNNG